MSIPRSVAEILNHHITFELECIDRMYLNVYVPALQCEGGVVGFFRRHRGQPFASSALMDPMTKSFVAATERFAKDHDVPIIPFEKGQRKDDVMDEQLRHFGRWPGRMKYSHTVGRGAAMSNSITIAALSRVTSFR